MNKMTLILAVLIFVIIGVIINYFGKKQKVNRALDKLPQQSISGLQTNSFSKVTGEVKPVNSTLTAPLSKKECVYFVLKIEQMIKSGKNNNWNVIAKDEQITDFLIAHNSSLVVVSPKTNPNDFDSYVSNSTIKSIDITKKNTPEIENLLDKYKVNKKGFLGYSKNLKFTEAVIEVNDTITVAGVVKHKNLNEPIEGYSYSKIVSLVTEGNQKLVFRKDQ